MDLFPDYDEISFIAKFIAFLLYAVFMLGIGIGIRKYTSMKLPETIMALVFTGLVLGLFFMVAIIVIPFDFMRK